MELLFCLKVCVLRILDGVEMTEMYFISVDNNARPKFVSSRAPLDAKHTCSVVFMSAPLVLQVLAHSGFAEICYAVIRRIAVNTGMWLWKQNKLAVSSA